MQIEMKNPADLLAYENNARTHSNEQIEQIANSIKNFGFNDPIEITPDNVIVSGHARALAALKLGLNEVPTVTLAGMDENSRKAYILAANRTALSAGWDVELLKIELGDLDDDEFDLSLTGFTEEEIESYLNPEILNAGLGDEDDAGELPDEPVTKLGDVWICGNHRVACGDSTNPDHVLKLKNGHQPNLMVTDPPYGVDYKPEWRNEALGENSRSLGKVKNDTIVDWSDAYSLFTGDVIYVWHAGKYTHIVSQNIIDCGYEIISQIIWVKNNFALSRGDYHWQHEPCVYAVKQGAKHNWQGARDQSTTWQIESKSGKDCENEKLGHSTQKPLDCMLRPIINNSKKGEHIYDPFCGSGTTLMACEKSNRKCLTQELDPKYVDMAVARWEKFTGQKAILESTGEEFDV